MKYAKKATADSDSVSGDSCHSDTPTTRTRGRRKNRGRGRRRSAGGVKRRKSKKSEAQELRARLARKPELAFSIPPKESFVAVDCEMVGVSGNKSALAKCTILDYDGRVLFDEYVRPEEKILDYRTRWSGVRPEHMEKALAFPKAVRRIKSLLEGAVVIGHDLIHDFLAIGMDSSKNHRIRDTATFVPLRQVAGLSPRQRPSLRYLSATLLGRTIQNGSHCSVEDAQAALDIYRKYEKPWEDELLDDRVWLQDEYWPEEMSNS